MPETMKLLGSTKSKLTQDENGENVPHFEITEVVLINCNIVNNDYQQNSRVLYTFVPSKSFGQLLDISPKNYVVLKTFNPQFPYIEVWFTDQNSRLLEINLFRSKTCKRLWILLKNMGKNIGKNVSKNLRGKYSQKRLDHAKQSATDAFKTASNRAVEKTGKQLVI